MNFYVIAFKLTIPHFLVVFPCCAPGLWQLWPPHVLPPVVSPGGLPYFPTISLLFPYFFHIISLLFPYEFPTISLLSSYYFPIISLFISLFLTFYFPIISLLISCYFHIISL